MSSASGSFRAAWRRLSAAPMASYYLVLTSSALLIVLGVMMVLSASSVYAYLNQHDSYYFVKRQLVFAVVGVIAAAVLSRTSLKRMAVYAWVGYVVSFILLLLTFSSLAIEVNGNVNWVQLGSSYLRLQPSEFAKWTMIVWSAVVLANKEKLLDQPRHLLLPVLPGSGLFIVMVAARGDMGTAVIMAGILAGVLWAVGTPVRLLVGIAAVPLLGMVVMTATSPNRMRRLWAFLNPSNDTNGVNMQALVGQYALATGGLWGVSLGGSRQKWGSLPEAHTDFIFAVIGEELGLAGALFVLALFAVLGYAGLRIAQRSDSLFCRVASAGITTWFGFQALVNLAVVLRMLPVMGVPLPMVSYGGSALLANMMALGVLLACARNEPAARAALAARRSGPRPRMTTVVGTRRG